MEEVVEAAAAAAAVAAHQFVPDLRRALHCPYYSTALEGPCSQRIFRQVPWCFGGLEDHRRHYQSCHHRLRSSHLRLRGGDDKFVEEIGLPEAY